MQLTTTVYQAPETIQVAGRQDEVAGRFFQIWKPWYIYDPVPLQPGIVLLGFACDLGVARNQGRVGAAKGPLACFQWLAKLPAHVNCPIYWAGILGAQHDLAAAQKDLATVIQKIHQGGHLSLVIGGGHETAFGHYLGLTEYHDVNAFGIVNLDAHLDLRPVPEDGVGNSGTSFLQIAMHRQEKRQPFSYHCWGVQPTANTKGLFETAKKLNASTLLAGKINNQPNSLITAVNHVIDTYEAIYLSICLDVLASAHAPGVSAPTPLGLTPNQLLPAIQLLLSSGKVKAVDIVELAPPLDQGDQTARLAAAMVAEVMQYHAVT